MTDPFRRVKAIAIIFAVVVLTVIFMVLLFAGVTR